MEFLRLESIVQPVFIYGDIVRFSRILSAEA